MKERSRNAAPLVDSCPARATTNHRRRSSFLENTITFSQNRQCLSKHIRTQRLGCERSIIQLMQDWRAMIIHKRQRDRTHEFLATSYSFETLTTNLPRTRPVLSVSNALGTSSRLNVSAMTGLTLPSAIHCPICLKSFSLA
jgi:hypothetical protein